MANKILFRRGPKSRIPRLAEGEGGHCTDTGETFIGTAYGNVHMDGDKWLKGTDMSGTSTTTGAYSYSACPPVKLGDTYLNTSNGNVYECTTAGSGTTAKWTYKGSIRGATGAQGPQGKDATKGDVIKWWIGSMVKSCVAKYDASTATMIANYVKANISDIGPSFGIDIDARLEGSTVIIPTDWYVDGDIVYLPELGEYDCLQDERIRDITYYTSTINDGSMKTIYSGEAILYLSKKDKKAYILWTSE